MEKFLLLALFGICMAHFEGVTVVYLRRVLGITNSQSNKEFFKKIDKNYILIEKTREIATILILVILALLVGEKWLDMMVVFLWTFAFWDLFYSNTSSLDCTGLDSNWDIINYYHNYYYSSSNF